MVATFLPFIGLTIGALIKQVLADYTADIAKKKLANSFLIERIDDKLEKKLGKDYLKKRLSDHNLELVRKVLHEELSAFSPRKDIDQLVVNSLRALSDEHQEILLRLDNVESLLEKIAIPLSYTARKEFGDEVPEELLSGLLEGSLKGTESSKRVLSELTEKQKIPETLMNTISEYQFLSRITQENETEISRLAKKFSKSPDEINNLSTLMEISTLLTGSEEKIDNIVSEFVFKLIADGLDNALIEDSVISFCFLVHRLGKIDLLSQSDKLILNSFLRKSLTHIDDPTRMLEAYFLLSSMNMVFDIDQDFIIDVVKEHQRRGFDSSLQMKGQLKINNKLARFLKKIGFKSAYKAETSFKTVNYLIRKLEKRKFARSTQLLKFQLERLTSEINLLIIFFEKQEPTKIDLTELIELLQTLLEILNQPNIYKLDLETQKRVVETMDATCYLYDLCAIRNSWNLLTNYEMNVKSVYSPTLGEYKRVTKDEAAFNLSLNEYSRDRLKKIEQDLPSPPKKPIKQKVKRSG
ncbi:MAG: hypothetical protein EAX86_09900 [Candidatus Heimdallarchaeota archaeon]|nr:hypothetical protein [Candidatus Heimdallarchaeota archaeon]